MLQLSVNPAALVDLVWLRVLGVPLPNYAMMSRPCQEWVVDDVLVKMEAKPFGAGAMRECYAMKKMSTFVPVSEG